MYPCSRMHNVAGDASHVGQKSGSREDDGVVSDEGSEAKEEEIKVEEQPVANIAAPLQHFEGKVADET